MRAALAVSTLLALVNQIYWGLLRFLVSSAWKSIRMSATLWIDMAAACCTRYTSLTIEFCEPERALVAVRKEAQVGEHVVGGAAAIGAVEIICVRDVTGRYEATQRHSADRQAKVAYSNCTSAR